MKSPDNTERSQQDNFSALSFSCAPNQSFEIDQIQTQEQQKKQSYCFIISFVILGFYFLVFGIIELATNFNEIYYRLELQRNGKDYVSKNTFMSFSENTKISIYLEMEHLTQFNVGIIDEVQVSHCHHFMTNQQINKKISIINTPLNPSEPAIPCGLYASLYPEGSFQITELSSNKKMNISTQNIVSQDYLPQSNTSPGKQWADVQNPRFKNWMVLDAQEKIKKLWGRITDVVSGNYQIKLSLNNEMPQIQKFVVSLTNNSSLGGFNNQLCYVNFFYALLVFVAALTSFLVQKKWGHRKVLKKKPESIGQSNQIKIFLNSAASTPAVKFD